MLRVAATHPGNLDGVLSSWLWLGSALATVGIWGVNPRMIDLSASKTENKMHFKIICNCLIKVKKCENRMKSFYLKTIKHLV